jgi:hypothetical protein
VYGVVEELPRAEQPEAALKVKDRLSNKRALDVMLGN